ncbi:hypothetical protein CHS0354_024099 [Potamilus streckersoni]|uniref:Ferredoxin--nitrite reductase, chloroplastic n=1 Tax=Potamilus streckersoni TaxID=2493646 RepID=A0AAE0RZS8_9BIVA|nr:hypothetical protein CHS0354_024099 [Potamilus streckersoni]
MGIKIEKTVDFKAAKDILELENKIGKFRDGVMGEDDFRKLRLTRGVYGQRQPGVQMVRIKLPYGRMTCSQLLTIADCADKYATGILHATTRQDIQIHYVKLSETPQLWADLESNGITLREACGNTVRNVTASPNAGVDPDEPFDVSPYAHAIYKYFLRNPICQDMGRKIKIALSSSDKDSAFTYMHDIGLIPIIKNSKRGFKIVVGGGLGAQPFMAQTATEWIEEERAIPLIEAFLRVFDRYGERTRRHKARIKFLVNDLGLDQFLRNVQEEMKALKNQLVKVDETEFYKIDLPNADLIPKETPKNRQKFELWKKTNTYEQKQKGYFVACVRVKLGDIDSQTARKLAKIVKTCAGDDIRVTVNQGFMLRFVKDSSMPFLFNLLDELGLGEPGFDSVGDIISCPGTSTCNLGITSSKGVTSVLEEMIQSEYKDLILNSDIKIKISGCMNGCGQHSIANIGFHGSSIKRGGAVLPAMQVLIGGGFNSLGTPSIADKITKVPTKSVPDVVRVILSDYLLNKENGEMFNDYYSRVGKIYYFDMIKKYTDVSSLTDDYFIDWGHEEKFKTEIGVGECAGVMVDLIGSIIEDAEVKLSWAFEAFTSLEYADAIYHAYNVMINGAKALLTLHEKETNTQYGLVTDFDKLFAGTSGFHKQSGIGELLIIGAGPGDPELLTIKAVNALKRADVVLYDSLCHPDLLAYCPLHAIKVLVGKRHGSQKTSQHEINRLIIDYAKKYSVIARLKGGDPFVFGRVTEELDAALSANLNVEIFPGLSSCLVAPALEFIPITMRHKAEGFFVVTATNANCQLPPTLSKALTAEVPIVILMGFHKINEIVKTAMTVQSNDLPIAVIQNTSLPNSICVLGTLSTIEHEVKLAKLGSPAIIIIGDVVRESKKYLHLNTRSHNTP